MRVVSLLASATEIVCALGAGEMLVGRSHECDNPSWVRRLPACSEPAFDVSVSSGEIDAEVRRRLQAAEPLYNLHADLIRELAPDLVISQAHCEVCAVTPRDLERSGACAVTVDQLSLSASSLEGIFESIQVATLTIHGTGTTGTGSDSRPGRPGSSTGTKRNRSSVRSPRETGRCNET